MQDGAAAAGLPYRGKCRGYGRDISDLAPLFPVQTSHAKSCGSGGVGVGVKRLLVNLSLCLRQKRNIELVRLEKTVLGVWRGGPLPDHCQDYF